MKQIDVHFANGRGALNAYWGYLSSGGLVLEDNCDLREGQLVSLNVRIGSAPHTLGARVVRRRPQAGKAVVAFDAGESGRFLSAALSESPVDLEAQVQDLENLSTPTSARLLNVSDRGCCVALAPRSEDADRSFEVGAEVILKTPHFIVEGTVVWAVGNERGVMFSFSERYPDDDLIAYLRTLNR